MGYFNFGGRWGKGGEVGQGGAKWGRFWLVGGYGGDIGKDGENAPPCLTSPPPLHLRIKILK